MRRNCPHCGVDQVVADEKLTTGWVFLKCHHCAAVSPVQGRAAFNLSQAAEKALRSPRSKPESKIEILPESKLASKTAPKSEVILESKPELVLESKPESFPEFKLESKLELKPEAAQEAAEEQLISEPRFEMTASALKLPPVPEFLKSDNSKLIETSSASSGSQSADEPMLFENVAQASGPVPILLEEEEAPNERLEAALVFAAKIKGGLGEKFTQFRPYALPVALAIICFGSGSYLIRSARLLRQGSWIFSSPTSALVASDVAPVSDPVAQQDPVSPQAPAVARRAPASVQTQANLQAPLQVSVQPAAQSSSDSTLSKIAASAKLRRSATDPKNEKKVEVLADNAVLRAGPGTHYNKVGTARAELQLLVKGQFDNWIEVRTGNGDKTAWIRNDLVKPLKEVAQQEAQP